MRYLGRIVWLVLLIVGTVPALAQTAAPQRPFGQLVDLWTRQLDRIASHVEQGEAVIARAGQLTEHLTKLRGQILFDAYSMFLQNPVVNRTYSDTSSRVEIKLTVGLATDVATMEGLLREAALGHPRVLRVPAPIVRFERITPTGLEFELYVFVARLEDRLVVGNDLHKAILAKMIELKVVDPKPVPELKLRREPPVQPRPDGTPGGPADAAPST